MVKRVSTADWFRMREESMGRRRTIKVVDTAAEDRRRIALVHAIAVSPNHDSAAEAIVKQAKMFEKFLKGK